MTGLPDCIPRTVLVSNLVTMIGMQKGHCTYLELGTAYNETLEFVAKASPQARCIGVDRKAVDPGLPNVTVYSMETAEYLAQFAGADGPFDVAYIDADHNFPAVLADFRAVVPSMADQSLILLDDTWPVSRETAAPGYCSDAYRMYSWLRLSGAESVTIPAYPGLTIVRIKGAHLPWS